MRVERASRFEIKANLCVQTPCESAAPAEILMPLRNATSTTAFRIASADLAQVRVNHTDEFVIRRPEQFTDRQLAWFQRVYISETQDTIWGSIFLLTASAAVAAAATRLARWHWSRKFPSRETFLRELTYTRALHSLPRWCRDHLGYKSSLLLFLALTFWAGFEFAILFSQTPATRSLTISTALRHVISQEPANLLPRRSSEPCRRVEWSAGGVELAPDLAIDRCINVAPAPYAIPDAGNNNTHFATVLSDDGVLFSIQVATNQPDVPVPMATMQTYVYDRAGLDANLADPVDAQALAPAFLAALQETPCPLVPIPPESIPVTDDATAQQLLRWTVACSVEVALESKVAQRLINAAFDHVDVRMADSQDAHGPEIMLVLRDGGVAPSEARIGTVTVPRLNLMGALLVGIAGVCVYLAASLLPDLTALDLVCGEQSYDQIATISAESVKQ